MPGTFTAATSDLTARQRNGRRLLVLSTDPIGPEMPGPAIRAWNLAQVLGQHMEVVLASTVAVSGAHPNAELRLAAGPALAELVASADVSFAPSALVYMARELRETDKPVAVDIYDPVHLENLEMGGDDVEAHDRAVARQAGVINVALLRGDFFTCASERQRDFWLGSLAALGRVNPFNYGADPLLEELVSVVPYGLPSEPPRQKAHGLRGTLPGIGPNDKVVLWGGGVYNWLDPVSLLRAVDRLRHRVADLRLVFLGLRHPNPDVPEMAVATELQALAAQLGLTGKHVFFNPGWVPYERRADFLLDADVAVSTHLDHLETRYSFRSRVLDYLWAGLPMVLTGGDVLAAEVAAAGLGVTVPAGDVAGLEQALAQVLSGPPPRYRFTALAQRYTWERAAQPLVEFCLAPRRAPDLMVERLSPEAAATG
jgi:glycosyltransferase involved in cell wall biosynthesis